MAAGLIRSVKEVERDEVVGIGVGATMTVDITVVLTEIAIIDNVAMVAIVIAVITAIFPVSNSACMTLRIIQVNSVGSDVIRFNIEDSSVIITYIILEVTTVNDAAVIVNVTLAVGIKILSFAAEVDTVLIVVVIPIIKCKVEKK